MSSGAMLTFPVRFVSQRRVLAGNRLDLDALHCRFRIPAAAVTTSDAELRSMIATEKNRFLRLIYPSSAVGAVCFQLGE